MGYNHYCQKHPAGIPVFPIKRNKKTEKESYPGKSNFHYLYLLFFAQCYLFLEVPISTIHFHTQNPPIMFFYIEFKNLISL